MNLIDSHCHLDFPELAVGLEQELNACADTGVNQIVIPGVTSADWQRVLTCTDLHHPVTRHAALGLHPCFLNQHSLVADIDRLESLIRTRSDIIAVGECGLDLFLEDPQLELQQELFNAQLELAKQFDLPVILHVRRSVDLVLKSLRRHKVKAGGVAHAFSGSLHQAREFAKLGFLIGVGGAITYERAQRLRKVVVKLPLEQILLETDAPDMPLHGFQGELNRPSRVKLVAECLAQLRGISNEEVAEQTTANAKQLFAL